MLASLNSQFDSYFIAQLRHIVFGQDLCCRSISGLDSGERWKPG